MDSAFLDLLPDTVTVQREVQRTLQGQPIHGTPEPHPARVIYRRRRVRGPRGSNCEIARGECWLPGAAGITTADRLTLPDGTCPPILAVERLADEQGAHHTKVYFG